jgi:hypothetical protein
MLLNKQGFPSISAAVADNRVAKRAGRVIAVAGVLLVASFPAVANDSIYTPTDGPKCVTESNEGELAAWNCPGAGEYRANFVDTGNIVGLNVRPHGIKSDPNDTSISWRGARHTFGKQVEWRTANGKPISAILRVWRNIEKDVAGMASFKTSEELLVIKLLPKTGCRIGSVSAHIPDANAKARQLADSAGPDTPCLAGDWD